MDTRQMREQAKKTLEEADAADRQILEFLRKKKRKDEIRDLFQTFGFIFSFVFLFIICLLVFGAFR